MRLSCMLTNAIQLHQEGLLDEAFIIYQQILSSDKNNIEVLHLSAILLSQQKKFAAAKSFLEKALELKNNSAVLHCTMGNILRNLNDIDKAIIHYKTAIKIDPNNFAAENNLGIIFYQQDQFSESLKHYNRAININNNFIDAYFNRALVYFKLNNFDEATTDLEQVLILNPKHFEAHYQLALIKQTTGDLNTASNHYIKTLRINPNHSNAHNNFGAILKEKNKFNAAIKHCKKALVIDPNNFDAYYNLGAIFLEQNKSEIALKYFMHLTQFTKDFTVYYNLGVIYTNLVRATDAITYFLHALNLNPHNFATLLNLGALYLKIEDYVNAKKYYAAALEQEPTDSEIQYILAAIDADMATAAAPEKYIKNLFDQYAPTFDKHLAALNYKAPQIIFDAITSTITIVPNSLNILDLGCGTGLSGEKLRNLAKKLIGLDLAEQMLVKARAKNIYDELIVCDINKNFANIKDIDLIIAVDTLVYIGDLENIFLHAKKTLKNAGFFAFTLEQTNHFPYLLQKSARFAHSAKYITELAQKNNFHILFHNSVALRQQRNVAIMGYIYILKLLQ